ALPHHGVKPAYESPRGEGNKLSGAACRRAGWRAIVCRSRSVARPPQAPPPGSPHTTIAGATIAVRIRDTAIKCEPMSEERAAEGKSIEGKPLPEERAMEGKSIEGEPLPEGRVTEGESIEGESLPDEWAMEGESIESEPLPDERAVEGKSIAVEREGAGSHEM